MKLTPEDQKKQIYYRDARTGGYYGEIWTTVGKCVFCDLRDKYIFFEENGMVLTVALFAYTDGNAMIVPRRHIKSVKELTESEWHTARKMMYIAKKLVRSVHDIKGLQYLIRDGGIEAQSTVSDHLHIHCVPFDAPDLSVWNYRQLKYTPLQSAQLYRNAGKKIIKADLKFENAYKQPSGLPLVCDLVLVNDKQEVLLVKRHKDAIILPPHDTTPGGHVDNFEKTLEAELAREVFEETGLQLDATKFQLIASRIDNVYYQRHSQHLDRDYQAPHQFLWNTYCLKGLPSDVTLTPGDDAIELYWLPLDKVATHPTLTPAIRDAIIRATR